MATDHYVLIIYHLIQDVKKKFSYKVVENLFRNKVTFYI